VPHERSECRDLWRSSARLVCSGMTLADDRLAALERQVAALTEEVARLRAPDNVVAAPRTPPPKAPSRPPILPHPSITGDEIESLVGRYGTLIFAALVILMGVGVLIKVA